MGIIAEIYRGSGRPTGRAWEGTEEEWEELRDADIAHGYAWFETWEEHNAAFEAGEHDQCHSPGRADDRCSLCQKAGWA